jgi:hypothetical protein
METGGYGTGANYNICRCWFLPTVSVGALRRTPLRWRDLLVTLDMEPLTPSAEVHLTLRDGFPADDAERASLGLLAKHKADPVQTACLRVVAVAYIPSGGLKAASISSMHVLMRPRRRSSFGRASWAAASQPNSSPACDANSAARYRFSSLGKTFSTSVACSITRRISALRSADPPPNAGSRRNRQQESEKSTVTAGLDMRLLLTAAAA